jgi:hypothetical protein
LLLYFKKEDYMAQVRVKIKSIAPLLMHRFPFENENEETAKKRGEVYDPVADSEKALYKNDKGCYAPSTWIEACLRDTAKDFKKGKSTYKATVLASVFVDPEQIPLNKQTYDEIDRRPVVIQRNRIVRARPRFNSWELEFTINFDDKILDKKVLKQILEEAGKTKGIGDYRPKYGRFEVVSFE